MSETPRKPPPWQRLLAGRGGKLMLVGGLLGLLLLPHQMIEDLILEREAYSQDAQDSIARSWGPPQSLLGPVLVVPGAHPQNRLTVLPLQLKAETSLAPERRRRGLFEAVVYEAETRFSALFTIPPALPREGELLWQEAYLLTGATELRGLDGQAQLSLDGRALVPREGGVPGCQDLSLIRWDLGLAGRPDPAQSLALQGRLALRGTGSFGLRPLARQAELTVAAPWPSPGFQGAGLPVRVEWRDGGFTAQWREGAAGGLTRGPHDSLCHSLVAEAPVGLALREGVPTYRMVTRASKYAAMFLALAFLTYALFELLAGIRIHPVQYALLGLSVVLFPLLLLALGEPFGFATAYAVSVLAVVVQASAHTAAVTRRARLAGVFAAVLGALFGFLYIVLSLEAYALLTGAVALFAGLSVVMHVTRRVDWSAQ